MDRTSMERFLEFLIIGVVMGVVEDLIAIKLATDAAFDPRVLGIVVLVAIPFAAFSELIVDREDFLHLHRLASRVQRILKKDESSTPTVPQDAE